MKNFKIFLLFGALLLIFPQACKKDALQPAVSQESSNEENGLSEFNVTDQSINLRSDEEENVKTILGNLRQNPFTVEKMAQAHNNLYGTSISAMKTTHLYVKFTPASMDDIKALEATDLIFFDFPLEYEVVEMGDYFQEIREDKFPVLYAVATPEFVFPNVAHELIANLYLDKSDPFLLAESFRLTGNTSKIVPYVFPTTGLTLEELGGNQVFLDVPDQPECDPGCTPVLIIDTNTIPFTYIWHCDCTPPPPPPTNGCGCPVYSSSRKPAGCVKVEDTQFSTPGTPSTFLPVRRVEVIAYDGWFNIDITHTDDGGCWKIDDAYHGNAWFWVKFKNSRCKIRGTEGNWHAAWQWLTTVTDYVGKLPGPTYNNISVNYNMWTSNGSNAHRYWGAATVNNALHEFHDYAGLDGITPPPNGMDIFIGHNHSYGYTLMSTQTALSAAAGAAMASATFWAGPFAGLIGVIGFGATLAYLPDVYIGINYTRSDRQKSLAYHEIAHSSHFAQVGSGFWLHLVSAEIFANGHGTSGSSNAGIIAVCESWAEYLGHLYADKTYGGSSSLGITWATRLERTRDETTSHIPIGLYNDLVDVGEPTFAPGVTACNQDGTGCIAIPDAVSGFTNAQMFSCLSSGTTSPASFISCLISTFIGATGNTPGSVGTLFASY